MPSPHDAPPNAPPSNGGMYDPKGRWIPHRLIKPVDLARHQLVLELAAQAREVSDVIAAFKKRAMDDIQAFLELSAEQYGAKLGGAKGNLTLLSFDGRYKIIRSTADQLAFDERLQVAKALVDECIHEWAEGSRDEIRALVEHAFQVDKEGKVSAERVLGLRRIGIKHPKWTAAMEAISDSVRVVASKAYLRVYERVGDSNEYVPISLDAASV
jgi:hypothetical protein